MVIIFSIFENSHTFVGFPCDSAGKEYACNGRDLCLIPELGRSPGERNGYPLQYSGLETSMDYTVHGVSKSQTWLSDLHNHFHTILCFVQLIHSSESFNPILVYSSVFLFQLLYYSVMFYLSIFLSFWFKSLIFHSIIQSFPKSFSIFTIITLNSLPGRLLIFTSIIFFLGF